MGTLIMVGQLLLALSILVILHEGGHFLPAKWFKTRVEKFYLFFDPYFSVVKKQIGETEYGIGWLPLGGYVKIAGMIDESMDKEQMKLPPQPWEFRAKPAWQRLIIMLGGVIVNFLLGIALFAFVAWHWGKDFLPTSEAKFGLQVDSTMLRAGFQQGDLLLQVGNKKLEKVSSAEFLKAVLLDNVRSCVVLRNGQPMGIPLSETFASEIQKNGGRGRDPVFEARVPFFIDSLYLEGAQKSGLRKGDRIISINGINTPFYQDYNFVIQPLKNQSVKIGVLRNGADSLFFDIKTTDDSKIGVVARSPKEIFNYGHESFSLAASIPQGWRDASGFLSDQISAFAQMFRGKIKAKDNLGSLISIGKMYGPVWDWSHFWAMTASLSIILAFMNLLPIPALDGGYVLFLLWEVVTGRRVSDSFMEKAITVGFILLLGLMVIALGLDVFRHF